MSTDAGTVFVVDDDAAFLKAVTRLLRVSDFDVRSFPSAAAFLNEHDPAAPGCLVLDVAMPGLDGLELQQTLAARGCERSIVFITGQGDIPMGVQAMKAGAVNFLTKPFEKDELLAAVREALEKDRLARSARAECEAAERRLASLTPREREVLSHVIAGRLNKQIAGDLGAAEKTVKVHRGRVMEKMGVRSVAELVRLCATLKLPPVERAIAALTITDEGPAPASHRPRDPRTRCGVCMGPTSHFNRRSESVTIPSNEDRMSELRSSTTTGHSEGPFSGCSPLQGWTWTPSQPVRRFSTRSNRTVPTACCSTCKCPV